MREVTVKTFADIEKNYAMLCRRNKTLERLNDYYRAQNYSIRHRNKNLVWYNRLLFGLDLFMVGVWVVVIVFCVYS